MCKLPDKIQPKTKEQLKQLINYAFKHDIYDLNFIDTSKITDMYELFPCVAHNFNVSSWDVSNVIDMFNMFDGCDGFNCDLSSWDVTKAKATPNMFNGCDKMTIPNWYKNKL